MIFSQRYGYFGKYKRKVTKLPKKYLNDEQLLLFSSDFVSGYSVVKNKQEARQTNPVRIWCSRHVFE